MERSRRKFLLASTATTVGLLAGCSGSEEMEETDPTETTTDRSMAGTTGGEAATETTREPTNTPTMTPTTTVSPTATATSTAAATSTPTTTATTTAASESTISIENSTLEKQESSYRTEAYALGTVVNGGSGVSGQLSLEARFYDDEDNLLDSTTGTLPYLKPGETWVGYLPYLDDGEAVKSHEIDGEYETEPPKLEVDGVSVADASMSKTEYDATVTGTVENSLDEDVDYLGALARFWRDDVILAGGLDNITDVPAGENWSFEASYMGYGERWEGANDFDVIPEVSIF
ncbi:FxLYD domain-containing protein [Halorussus litoreus]|uniref:FxLYD domain-containing protein n=1 Tax=Halorussus litoreus TaxID=1710536 RepID=UPI000E22E34D|nr:FxLYD domain-containing protein [Halorussus litoreus]